MSKDNPADLTETARSAAERNAPLWPQPMNAQGGFEPQKWRRLSLALTHVWYWLGCRYDSAGIDVGREANAKRIRSEKFFALMSLASSVVDGQVTARGILHTRIAPETTPTPIVMGWEWWTRVWYLDTMTTSIDHQRPFHVLDDSESELARCVVKEVCADPSLPTMVGRHQDPSEPWWRIDQLTVIATVSDIHVDAFQLAKEFPLNEDQSKEVASIIRKETLASIASDEKARTRGGHPKIHDDDLYRRIALNVLLSKEEPLKWGDMEWLKKTVARRAEKILGLKEGDINTKAVARAINANWDKTPDLTPPNDTGENGK